MMRLTRLVLTAIGIVGLSFGWLGVNWIRAVENNDYPYADLKSRAMINSKAVRRSTALLSYNLPSLNTSGYKVWTAPCVVKILPSDRPPQQDLTDQPVLGLAKNETRCFQLALTGERETRVPRLKVETDHSTITSRANLEALIPISRPSLWSNGIKKRWEKIADYVGDLPDPLIPWSYDPYMTDDPTIKSSSLKNLNQLRAVNSKIKAGQTRAILIDITTTARTPSGMRSLTIEMGSKKMTLPIYIYDFVLDDEVKLKTTFGTGSFAYTPIEPFSAPLALHGVEGWDKWKDLIDNYYHESLSYYRLSPYTYYWTVQMASPRNYFYWSTLFTEYDCGRDEFKLKPEAEALLRKFLDGGLGQGYLKGEKIKPASVFRPQHIGGTQYRKPTGFSSCGTNWDDTSKTKDPSKPNWEYMLDRFYSAMYRYFSQKGWARKAHIAIDEPSFTDKQGNRYYAKENGWYRPKPLSEQQETLKRVWRLSKAVLEKTDFKIGPMIVTRNSLQMWMDDRLKVNPSTYFANAPVLANDFRYQDFGYRYINTKGYGWQPPLCDPRAPGFQKHCFDGPNEEFWLYNVVDPMYIADAPAVEPIMAGWMTYKYKIAGISFWSVSHWFGGAGSKKGRREYTYPWTHPEWSFANTNNAEVFWYPPCGDKVCDGPAYYVIDSLRLPLFREAVLDHEYLKILERKIGRQGVLALVGLDNNEWVATTTNWKNDPVRVLHMRQLIASKLDGNAPEPNITPTTPPYPSPTSSQSPPSQSTPTPPLPQPTSADIKALPSGFDPRSISLANYGNKYHLTDFADTKVYAGWGQDKLFLELQVSDNYIKTDFNLNNPNCRPTNKQRQDNTCRLWNDDSVEVFLDTKLNRGGQSNPDARFMQIDDYQIIINANGAVTDLKGTSDPTRPSFSFNLIPEVVSQRTDKGFIIKLTIPIKDLGLDSLTPKTALGLGIARDNINPNNQRVSTIWGSRGKSFQNASNWIPVTLIPSSQSCPDKAKGDANCDSKINLTDFTIWFKEWSNQCSISQPQNCFTDIDQDSDPMDADFNQDDKITLVDFTSWYITYIRQ